jgi:hypothetical protein
MLKSSAVGCHTSPHCPNLQLLVGAKGNQAGQQSSPVHRTYQLQCAAAGMVQCTGPTHLHCAANSPFTAAMQTMLASYASWLVLQRCCQKHCHCWHTVLATVCSGRLQFYHNHSFKCCQCWHLVINIVCVLMTAYLLTLIHPYASCLVLQPSLMTAASAAIAGTPCQQGN